MAHVLVVEDDAHVAELVQLYLTREGHRVTRAADGAAGLEFFAQTGADLVVLDLMLPGIDGWEVCRRLREHSDVPVVMLTARGSAVEKLGGFSLGADDYLVKPFDPSELVARVGAVLRRARAGSEAAAEQLKHGPETDPGQLLQLAGLTVDLAAREVTTPQGSYQLPAKEFDLLAHLARHPRQVFSRDALLETVWGYDYMGSTRTVDVHVKRLRDRLQYPRAPWRIQTVWSVGYKLEIDTPRH